MQASPGSMMSPIQERDLANQRSPHVPHMDPWAHQSAETASNTCVHQEPTSGPTSQPLKESTGQGGQRGVRLGMATRLFASGFGRTFYLLREQNSPTPRPQYNTQGIFPPIPVQSPSGDETPDGDLNPDKSLIS
jgi:hypothetical protein